MPRKGNRVDSHMQFYVVNHLLDRFQHAPVSTGAFPESPEISSVMWVPFPRSLDPSELDVFVSSSPAFVLRSDITVIGLHPSSAGVVQRSPHILNDVANRIENAPLYIVYHDQGWPVIRHISGNNVEGIESRSTLDRIREQDVAEVVRRPGAELPRHPGLHYEGPNKDHYEAFLRPGFATQSTEELDRIAFWLAPMLHGRRNLLVDHWSMIAIAYHIGSYSRDLGEEKMIAVESLRSYDEDIDLLVNRARSTFGAMDSDNSSETATGAILLSVNSSGRLAKTLLFPAMERVGFEDSIGIALAQSPSQTGVFADSDFEIQPLTKLDESFMRKSTEDCTVCGSGDATLIPIQHDSYLLNLAAHTQSVSITIEAARMSRDVVSRYRDIGAFHVHKTHDDRHHAFFIDLEPVLGSDTFKQRLEDTVDHWKNENIDMILHPDHDSAETLARMVASSLGVECIVCGNERSILNKDGIQEFSDEDHRALLRSRRICLVDDAVISGNRIRGYRIALNTLRRRYDRDECELYCVVGVARTESEKALMGVSDMLHHSGRRPRFLSIETLFLPNWGSSECRWCSELRILSSLPHDVRNRGLVLDRLEMLRRPEGLATGLFLPWSGDDLETVDRYWKLGRRSVFGEVQGADLAVSVAASVQRLRGRRRQIDGTWAESELDEVFRSPLAKVLDPQFYLSGRYYEPVLVASILRSSRRHDIRAPGNDSVLRDHVEALADQESSNELHGELMLAIALDQLPRNRNLENAIALAHPDIAALAESIAL